MIDSMVGAAVRMKINTDVEAMEREYQRVKLDPKSTDAQRRAAWDAMHNAKSYAKPGSIVRIYTTYSPSVGLTSSHTIVKDIPRESLETL